MTRGRAEPSAKPVDQYRVAVVFPLRQHQPLPVGAPGDVADEALETVVQVGEPYPLGAVERQKPEVVYPSQILVRDDPVSGRAEAREGAVPVMDVPGATSWPLGRAGLMSVRGSVAERFRMPGR